MSKLKLWIVSRLLCSLYVNTHKHPEYVTPLREDGTGKFCERNYLIANAMESIGKLSQKGQI